MTKDEKRVVSFRIQAVNLGISLHARNFTGIRYKAFTEPDPDGNAYQPGPVEEFFGNVGIRL